MRPPSKVLMKTSMKVKTGEIQQSCRVLHTEQPTAQQQRNQRADC